MRAPKRSTIVLGIDPGYCNTGWVAIDVVADIPVACGLIRTAKDKRKVLVHEDDWARIQHVASGLMNACTAHWPAAVVIEVPMGSRGAKAAVAMARAYAICACVAVWVGCPTVRVQAPDVKRVVTGQRDASKGQLARSVLEHWTVLKDMALKAVGRAPAKTEHIYDAAACVLGAWDSDVIKMARNVRRTT